jgi:hypothetical protein
LNEATHFHSQLLRYLFGSRRSEADYPAATRLSDQSNPNIILCRAFAARIARVADPTRFDQQELNFPLGIGFVLCAFRETNISPAETRTGHRESRSAARRR